jgi:hypothetical protein
MTTTDLWITNLSGGQSLYQHGGLFGSASDVALTLVDFIEAGRATAHPDHNGVTDLESTVSGDLPLELLRETEKRTTKPLIERDGHSSIQRIHTDHCYRIRFIEF